MKDVMTAATAVNAPPGLSGGGLDGRLDLLWQTAALSGGSGLQAEPATYHSLGNNGTVPLGQGVDYPGNTALSELPNQKDVLNALANDSSDHLPVVQTYQILSPGPARQGQRVDRPVLASTIVSFTIRVNQPAGYLQDNGGSPEEIAAPSHGTSPFDATGNAQTPWPYPASAQVRECTAKRTVNRGEAVLPDDPCEPAGDARLLNGKATG
jgi:hypothetical protein